MHTMIGALLVSLLAATASAQSSGPAPSDDKEKDASTASNAATIQDDDPDADIDLAQPDFTLLALPTTLRVPRHKSAFRVTHRFRQSLADATLADLFGIDNGAQIGLEYRFGLFRKTQVGFHRTSERTIELFGQRELVAEGEGFPVTIDAFVSIDGTNNLKDSYSPALGAIISREAGTRAAFYLHPMWVNNTNPLPEELVDDNSTFLMGLGARLRVRPTVYLVLEAAPRVAGYDPDVTHVSVGLEKRAGGHMFQLNFSNNVGTTPGQIARGGPSNDDWYLGFSISRKFF